tara:strand:- start:171 stop:581 length:411 start_codon:yes stop_codon:yes gene_type:complete
MGFIDKSTLAIDAILTNKGRDYLRKAVFGENQGNEHVITKFALGDDEIDYGLWDETVTNTETFAKNYGKVIDNQPLTEPNVNWKSPTDSEIMKSLLFKRKIAENLDNPTNRQKDDPNQVGPGGEKGGTFEGPDGSK